MSQPGTPATSDRLAEIEATLARIALLHEQREREEQRRRAEEDRQRAEADRLRAEERQVERKQREVEQKRHEERLEAQRKEHELDLKAWNRQRGELANKLGTLVEDMVAPSVPQIIATLFGLSEDDIERMSPRQRIRRGGESREYDVVTLFPGHALITESKTRLRSEDVTEFISTLGQAREFLPEIGDRRLVGAVASLYLDDAVAAYAERQGLIVVGLGNDLMEAKNAPGFVPRAF